MNRLDYFFRQLLSEQELDLGFDKVEAADQKLMTDQLLTGVFIGGEVAEHFPTPDLTVDIAGPMNAYDQLGRRIFFSPLQVLDMSVDELAVSTAVGTPGNEKILTIFVEFDRALSDPRLDGNDNTVYFQRAESFKFNVVQSAEAAIGTAVPPTPRVDQLILADVTIINAQTQILNADIDDARRNDVFNLTGSPNAIRVGRVKDALQDMLDLLNGGIGYAGGPNWADGTTNPATTVELQLDKIITDLAGAAGTAKLLGIVSANPNPVLTAVDLSLQLTELESAQVDGTKHGSKTKHGSVLWGYGEGAWGITTASGWPVWLLTGLTGDILYLPIPLCVGDELESVSFSFNSTDGTHDISHTVVKIDQHPTGSPIAESILAGPTVTGGSATTVIVSSAGLAHAVDSAADQYFIKIIESDVGVTSRWIRNYRWVRNRKAA